MVSAEGFAQSNRPIENAAEISPIETQPTQLTRSPAPAPSRRIAAGRPIVRDTSAVEPLVSVVVPVFNGLPHLVDLTASILTQTHTNLEIVFTEGGSSDKSPEFLATLTDPRVRILTMPKGTTAAQNWTAACEAATGTYIKLICQDDLIKTDAIQRQLADLLGNPTAVMAIAQRDIIDANGKVLYANRGLSGLKKKLLQLRLFTL